MNNSSILNGPGPDPLASQALEREQHFGRLFPLPGVINVPELAVTDLRYRLVQLHESMHGLHRRFLSETRQKLRVGLEKNLADGKLAAGRMLLAPQFFLPGEPIPAGFETVFTGPTGTCAMGEMPLGKLLINLMLVQFDELFVEFFSSAAAGAPYWMTIRDFAAHGQTGDRFLNQSVWYVESPGIFDPHPALWLRLQAFPRIYLKLMAEISTTWPNWESVLAHMRGHFDTLLRGKVPVMQMQVPVQSKDGTRTYEGTFTASPSDDLKRLTARFSVPPGSGELADLRLTGEAAERYRQVDCIVYTLERGGEEVQKYAIPLMACLPFYEAAFRIFIAMTDEWWQAGHPLGLFTYFMTPVYHEKIHAAAKEFVAGSPRLRCQFGDVRSAAAARLHFDTQSGLDLASLQVRALESLAESAGQSGDWRLVWTTGTPEKIYDTNE